MNQLNHNNLTPEQLAEKARRYVESPEGLAKLNAMTEQLHENFLQMEKEQRITLEQWLTPMTF